MKIGAANSYYLIRTCSESIEALEPGGIDQRASIVQEHALQYNGQCISLAYRPAIPPYPVIYSSYSSSLAAKGML